MYSYIIYFVMFSLLVPFAAAMPIHALYANSLGASYFEIGLITGTYSLAPLLLAVRIGKWVDRVGERIPATLGAAGFLVSLILPFFFPHYRILYITQLLLGASQMAALVALQNATASAVPPDKRERAVGTFSLFVSASMFLGPLLGGFLVEHWNFRTTYLVLSIMIVVPLLLAQWLKGRSGEKVNISRPVAVPKTKISREIAKNPFLLRIIIISMVTLTAADLFVVYFPLVGTASGLTPSQIGWIVGLQGIAYVFIRLFQATIIDRLGHSTTLYAFMFVGAIAYGLMPFFNQFYIFALVALILGLGLGLAQPMTIALTYINAPSGRTAETLSFRIACNRLAQLTLPVILSSISQVGSLASSFVIIALLLIGAAIIAKGLRPNSAAEG